MDDERKLLEVDSRVRAALQASDEVCRRVAARALADTRRRAPQRWRKRSALITTAALALTLIAIGLQWRRSVGRSMSLTVTSKGATLVIESQDGHRWIVGSSPPRRSGNYVMVVTE